MSTVNPVIAPIAPSEAQKANAPEPDSERAAEIRARKIEQFEDEGSVAIPPEDEMPAHTMALDAEIRRRQFDDK